MYDSTPRQPFSVPCIFTCLENTLKTTEHKDFKSRFAKKAKSDLIAYQSLKEKREAELEELGHCCGGVPREAPCSAGGGSHRARDGHSNGLPMDTSQARAEAADLPQGEMADPAKTESLDVPMETGAPESSPQGEASGVKVEPIEGSTKDEHMGETEDADDANMATESSPQGEEFMPDISPSKDDEGELHDQGIWGKCKNIVDPELSKAAKDAEAQNENDFDNLEGTNEKKGLVGTDEYKNFCSNLVKLEKRGCLSNRSMAMVAVVFITAVSGTMRTTPSVPSRSSTLTGVRKFRHVPGGSIISQRVIS